MGFLWLLGREKLVDLIGNANYVIHLIVGEWRILLKYKKGLVNTLFTNDEMNLFDYLIIEWVIFLD